MIPYLHFQAYERLTAYAEKQGFTLEKEFGSGWDGIVFSTSKGSAVKSLRYEKLFCNERDIYLRLQEKNVGAVLGFAIPRLFDYDNALWVIEMQIVTPPFVLDFAGAYLDKVPPFFRAELVPWEAEKREQFGSNWPRVKSIMSHLRRYGIHLANVKPGNIVFAEKPAS